MTEITLVVFNPIPDDKAFCQVRILDMIGVRAAAVILPAWSTCARNGLTALGASKLLPSAVPHGAVSRQAIMALHYVR
jgi:hypothetical protein